MTGWFVNANDIKVWTETNKRRAEELLPKLIKKLIEASCQPTEIDFPTGDSISIGGWDGILNVEIGNEYVPSGRSGWEFGTNIKIHQKANEDYSKRTKQPDPFDKKESTYVFVTSRIWSKKRNWETEKSKDNKWKRVKGLNADSIASWLHKVPSVHRWFAKEIGKRTTDCWDLDQAWINISQITEISLTEKFFLQGREEQCDELTKLLSKGSLKIEIKAQSKLESLGFVLAFFSSNEAYRSRFLMVKDQNAWDWIKEYQSPLILVPDGFQPVNIGATVASGHTVVICEDVTKTGKCDITLKRLTRSAKLKAIQSLGIQEDEAESILGDTKGFIEPILRHKYLNPLDFKEPEWIESTDPNVLVTILLAEIWDRNNEHDQEAISKISSKDYEGFEQEVFKLSNCADPPIRLVGNIWQVISKTDLWFLIENKITEQFFKRLEEVILEFLR